MDLQKLKQLIQEGDLQSVIEFFNLTPQDEIEFVEETAMVYACGSGWIHIVEYLYFERQIIMSSSQGNLEEACKRGDYGVVSFLLCHGQWELETFHSSVEALIDNEREAIFEMFLLCVELDLKKVVELLIVKNSASLISIFEKNFPDSFHLFSNNLCFDTIHDLISKGVSTHYFSRAVLDKINDIRCRDMFLIHQNV
jgi:hypothetical protein